MLAVFFVWGLTPKLFLANVSNSVVNVLPALVA